ncbi:dUTP diphosphatase [Tritonibacter horizontis]
MKILDPRIKAWGLADYQSSGAAAIDLYACVEQETAIEPQAPAILIPSGLAFNMKDLSCAALVLPRSGLGHKKGLVMGNSVGLIDADYTGQVYVSVWNRNPAGSATIVIQPGERIAQMMFVPILRANLTVVDEFAQTTERGAGGFGSTGTGGGAA